MEGLVMTQEESNRERGAHFLETPEGFISAKLGHGKKSKNKGHSLSEECQWRDLSGSGKTPTGQERPTS